MILPSHLPQTCQADAQQTSTTQYPLPIGSSQKNAIKSHAKQPS